MSAGLGELRDSARLVLNGLGLAADEQVSWAQIAELGWLMLSTPEELGGLGMGLAESCALHMELGRGLATAPFLPALLAIEAVCASAMPDKHVWLERLTTGETYVAAALAEGALHATCDGDGKLHLSGTASAVPSADRASHVLVYAWDEPCVVLVPVMQTGVEVMAKPTWDRTRRLFEVRFTGVVIDDQLVLARGAAARLLASKLATQRDFALAAEAVGGAAVLLELTVDYLQTRHQFGRPLALFQALKHRCADLKALTEGAAALLQDSLARFGGRLDDAERVQDAELAGKAAKHIACAAYMTVAEEALQLHGGIGMTSEHVCHLFLKRAMLDEHLGRGQQRYEADLAASVLDN
jgi:alkylation response protein AidB-like acyl-CoA dehydrogenase